MADILISQLPAGTPLLTDLLILANPTTGIAKKSTVTQLNSVLTLAKLSDVAQGTPPSNSILQWDGSFSYATNVVRAGGLNVNRIPYLESTGPLTLSSSQIYQGANGVEITEFSPANISSVLFGLFSNDKGFLMPRMVSQNRIDLPNPVKGLEVFDTTLNIPYFYNGTAWKGVQEVLVSATNIKTINGTTILGSGDLTIASGITTLNTLTASTQTFAVGSSGTDFTISSATSTHTFNLPTASASARGLLSSANWTTFNNKIGGSGTTNYLAKFTASGTVGDSLIFDNGTNVGIGTATPSVKLDVNGAGSILTTLRIKSTGGGTQSLIKFGLYDGSDRLHIGYLTSGTAISNNVQHAQMLVDDSGNINLISRSDAASGIRFSTTSTSSSGFVEAMRVTNDGKLWINRTTDDGSGAILQVNGGGSFTNSIIITGSDNNLLPIDGGIKLYNNITSKISYITCGKRGVEGYSLDIGGDPIVFRNSNLDTVIATFKNGNLLIGTSTNITSSKLTIDSTTQGILIPRMTTTQINAISSPATGLEVYNTTLQQPCFYDGSGWRKVSHTNM